MTRRIPVVTFILGAMLVLPSCRQVGATGESMYDGGFGDGPAHLEGYLVDSCAWQAYPQVAEAGPGCALDVFLSDTAPSMPWPEVCAGEPSAASCHFRAIDHTIDPSVRVRIIGDYLQTEICDINPPKGNPLPPACTNGRIFVPSMVVETENHTTGTVPSSVLPGYH